MSVMKKSLSKASSLMRLLLMPLTNTFISLDDDLEKFLERLPAGGWSELDDEEPDYSHIPYSNFSLDLEVSTQLGAVN